MQAKVGVTRALFRGYLGIGGALRADIGVREHNNRLDPERLLRGNLMLVRCPSTP